MLGSAQRSHGSAPPAHLDTVRTRTHEETQSRSAPVRPARNGSRGREKKQMFDIKRKTIDWAGRKLTLETGRMARQADAAVLATLGETMVLATAVYAKQPK